MIDGIPWWFWLLGMFGLCVLVIWLSGGFQKEKRIPYVPWSEDDEEKEEDPTD